MDLDRAAVEFVERYTRPDGTLVWREQWPGMDGSDDPYEGFQNFSLFYTPWTTQTEAASLIVGRDGQPH